MSRSGYIDDGDYGQWASICYRGAVISAIRGWRGQALLVALRDVLDAMPDKELITGELINKEGQCCALGCLAQAKDINVADIDPEDRRGVAKRFNIAPALAAEIAYENDEGARRSEEETPAKRWERMRAWVADQIKK